MKNERWNSTTKETVASPSPFGDRIGALEPGLVIAWCRDPSRVGEVARFTVDQTQAMLGRGDYRPDDGRPRLRFFRERPSRLEERGPLEGESLSRRQLVFERTPNGLAFQRVGACPVFLGGAACSSGTLRPGNPLRLGSELVLVFVLRPATESFAFRGESSPQHPFGLADAVGLIGESAAMWRLRADAAFAARAPGHVLILGETGVGKELVARSIHAGSERAEAPLVARSAASFPTSLVDAELFGSMRNFPNAGMPERRGLIGAAHGGTLFLDEIGELPLEAQSRMLRVLDGAGEYHRLGEATPRRANFRLIAATNRPIEALKADVAARFALRIDVPPLRERVEDLALLARGLVRATRDKAPALVSRFFDTRTDEPRLDPSFVEQLLVHEYTSNVRELGELLLRSVRDSRGDVLEAIPLRGRSQPPIAPVGVTAPSEERVRTALLAYPSASSAATALGLPSRFALYRLMKKYRISRTEVRQ